MSTKVTNAELVELVRSRVEFYANDGILVSVFMLQDELEQLDYSVSRSRITIALRTLIAGGIVRQITMHHFTATNN